MAGPKYSECSGNRLIEITTEYLVLTIGNIDIRDCNSYKVVIYKIIFNECVCVCVYVCVCVFYYCKRYIYYIKFYNCNILLIYSFFNILLK